MTANRATKKGQRSGKTLVRLCAALGLTGLLWPFPADAARAEGYLRAAGPAPLRFQIHPEPVLVVLSALPETAPVPASLIEPPVTELSQAGNDPTPQVLEPDFPTDFLPAQIWATLGENLVTPAVAAPVRLATPPALLSEIPPTPPVTAEMLADYFRAPEPPASDAATPAPPELTAPPAVIFVLPTSQATYRSP